MRWSFKFRRYKSLSGAVMAGRYRNPYYRQYMPQDLLDELRVVSRATRRPMQQIVRVAVRVS